LSDKQIEQGIYALEGVKGRMQRVDKGQNFDAVVDFAHTPDSFEKLLPDMKKATKGRLIVIFGSAGRRDESKRAIQGGIAGKYADIIIATEEDDRDVPGEEILEQIYSGAKKHGKKLDKDFFKILNRPQAIRFAVSFAKKGDTLLFLGKGHERTIERADGEYDWDEVAEVEQAIKERNENKDASSRKV